MTEPISPVIKAKPWVIDDGIDGLLSHIRACNEQAQLGIDVAENTRRARWLFSILDAHLTAGGKLPTDWQGASE